MKAISSLKDSKIGAYSILVEISIGEYVALVEGIINNNDFQRKRVKSSKTVYSLLKKDLQEQCLIPPIVLALRKKTEELNDDNITNLDLVTNFLNNKQNDFIPDLIILDGMQRTLTILDLLQELEKQSPPLLDELEPNKESIFNRVRSTQIRVEIYININKIGILYRMLTLNTGQTPMSLRQQIEMLYLDYLEYVPGNIQLVREIETKTNLGKNEYNFKDIIDGFAAYLERNELPLDKLDIVENINSLEKLAKETQNTEIFQDFLTTWHNFITKIIEICEDQKLSKEYINDLKSSPFGKDATQIFNKSQAMTGFGAAIGKMRDFDIIKSFDDVNALISRLELNTDDILDFLEYINNSLNWIRNNSKKIGNAQRTYFSFFFRELFNKETDSYNNLLLASGSALTKYINQNV